MLDVRHIALSFGLAAAAACAPHTPPVAVLPPGPTAADRLDAADALVKAGCYDCLVRAYGEYAALGSSVGVRDRAETGAFTAAALLFIRERELGLDDSGYLTRARDAAASGAVSPPALTDLLDIVERFPEAGVVARATEANSSLPISIPRDPTADLNRIAGAADKDALSAYLWVALNCTSRTPPDAAHRPWLSQLPVWGATPLILFKGASCGSDDINDFDLLLANQPRFLEANYFLGMALMGEGETDKAVDHLQQAYAWRPRWPAVTIALGTTAFDAEDFDEAARLFDEALAMLPASPDALLGRARTLALLDRYDESIVSANRLVALGHWYLGDAYYWRALDETELRRYDVAWSDIELAATQRIDAEVPKLAGIIAYERKQIDVAAAQFQESRARNSNDCETEFYLGLVFGLQTAWSQASGIFETAATCLTHEQAFFAADIAAIRASKDPHERQARKIARREQQIAADGRMLATTWFNSGVAAFNRFRPDDARRFIERVTDDPEFGERARDLLARLPAAIPAVASHQ